MRGISLPVLISMILAVWGCGGGARPEIKKTPPPAVVSNGGVKEADLATITLTPEAEKRLGIEVSEARTAAGAGTRVFAGEIVVPPGQVLTVTAPVAGTLETSGPLPAPGTLLKSGTPMFRLKPFAPVLRDLRVGVEAEAASARARVETAKLRTARAEQLLKDQVGSVRAREDAQQELQLAETALNAAQARLKQIEDSPLDADVVVTIRVPLNGVLRQLPVSPGQPVAAGAQLFEVADLKTVWLRVAVYTGDLGRLNASAPVVVRPLNADSRTSARIARPVAAPPSADPLAATADLYYQLANETSALRPGERLSVEIPERGASRSLQVPWAAVLTDIHGGTWVYEQTAPQKYMRRRVEVDRVSGRTATLTRGIKPGTRVAGAGAAELFATEFGAGK